MSNVNITRSGPEVMADNPAPETRRENADRATDYRPQPAYPVDWRVTAARFAGVALLILVIALILGLAYLFKCGLPWMLWLDYGITCHRWSETMSYAPLVAASGLLIYLAYRLWFGVQVRSVEVERGRVENARFRLLPDRFGNPTPADLYNDMTPSERFDSYLQLLILATELKRDTAPHEFLPSSLNTYSPSNITHQAALPEPDDQDESLALVPDGEWRQWLTKAPHLVIAGKTDAGKTTFQTMLLGEYIEQGNEVLILDPHWQPRKWFGLPAIAGVPAILDYLSTIQAELDARLIEFGEGKQTEEFDRLTILIDEVPAIVSKCIRLTASGRPQIIDDRWPSFAPYIGSEARKVGIRLILGSQSTQVADMLINKQMRENFNRVALMPFCRVLIGSESDLARKRALLDLLRGQDHPAVYEHKGQPYVLDVSNVPALAERSMRPLARVWQPRQMSRRVAAQSAGLSSDDMRISAKIPENTYDQTDRQTDRQWSAQKKIAVLRALRDAGLTRNQARARLERVGQGFNNDDWTIAGQ